MKSELQMELDQRILKALEKKLYIHRGDSFDLSFYGTFLSKPEYCQIWLNKKFKIEKDDTITYRIINHWTTIGLLDDERDDVHKWRVFSPMDNVWIHIIAELRRFGFSNKKILNSKKWLYRYNSKSKPDYELFSYYLTLAYSGIPVYLLVLSDGFCDICTEDEKNICIEMGMINANYLEISITRIVQKVLSKDKNNIKRNPRILVKSDELQLLYLLRTEKYSKIEIKMKDGKIKNIMPSEFSKDSKFKFKDLIKNKGYQSIRVEFENGKPVYIENTEKIKV